MRNFIMTMMLAVVATSTALDDQWRSYSDLDHLSRNADSVTAGDWSTFCVNENVMLYDADRADFCEATRKK